MDIEESSSNRIIIRRSITIFALRFIFWEILIALIYLIIRIVVNYYKLGSPENYFAFIFSTFVPILFTIIETSIAIYMLTKWMSEYYIISPGNVIFKSGLLFNEEREYSLSNVQSISFKQSLLGKLFGYGTVKLFSPALQQDLYFEEVHNPRKISELLKSAIPGDGNKFGVIIRR